MSEALQGLFGQTAQAPAPKRKKRPPPLSVRVSEDERQRLLERAGDQSLNAYIRSRIFGDKSRRSAPCRATLIQLLATFGASEVGASLRTIARSAEIGALVMDAETQEQLNTALAALIAMRAELLRALK